jgi:hypothetical protein
LMVIHHQHFKWLGECYAKQTTLAQKIGWASTRVAQALDSMSESKLWKKIDTDLPTPLTSERRPFGNGYSTYYHLRALRYEPNEKGIQTIRLRKSARERFGVPLPCRRDPAYPARVITTLPGRVRKNTPHV